MGIDLILIEIKEILINAEEFNWVKSFDGFIRQIKDDNEKNSAKSILQIYKGAGSFNDLVLYKDGIVCKAENDKLEELRHSLYITAGNVIGR